jgi:hypothetical protein
MIINENGWGAKVPEKKKPAPKPVEKTDEK